jgi:hypothetical protein
MASIKFFHGSEDEITKFNDGCIYVAMDINHAKASALNFSETGYIYEIEIDEDELSFEESFKVFDFEGYNTINNYATNVVFNVKSGFAFIKDPSKRNWKLIEKL